MKSKITWAIKEGFREKDLSLKQNRVWISRGVGNLEKEDNVHKNRRTILGDNLRCMLEQGKNKVR